MGLLMMLPFPVKALPLRVTSQVPGFGSAIGLDTDSMRFSAPEGTISDSLFANGFSSLEGMRRSSPERKEPWKGEHDVHLSTLQASPHRLTEAGLPVHVGGEPVYGGAGDDQEHPSVAFDGTNFLVVWQDKRSAYWDLYASRVTTGGIVLDTVGIAVTRRGSGTEAPSVIFDGANYFVVWQDKRASEWADIYGARISPDGIVLDPDAIQIARVRSLQETPAVAFDGENYLVVWRDYRTPSDYSDIYGARVTSDGVVLDPDGIAISTAPLTQRYPALAFDGTNYLVAWQDYRRGTWDICGARVSSEGVVLDTAGIVISIGPQGKADPEVAFDGKNYLVLWGDSRGDSWDIYGTRVDVNGVVLDSSGIGISTAAMDQGCAEAVFDGTDYLVVWHDKRNGVDLDIFGTRVTSDGTVLHPEGFVVFSGSEQQLHPAVALGSSSHLVVWEDGLFSADICGGRVTSDGMALDPEGIPISLGANEQDWPAVAFDGVNYLVVWQDDRAGPEWDIYGMRVGSDGEALDDKALAICTAPGDQGYPAAGFDGSNYLVVWEDYANGPADIRGARVGADGIVLDPASLEISIQPNNQYDPSIAFDGTNYLVVWADARDGESYDIYGTRISRDGVVLDPEGMPISIGRGGQFVPSVAFGPGMYLVVWADTRNDEWNTEIYGARLIPDGLLLDPAGFRISSGLYRRYCPDVASDGVNFLVVWDGQGGIQGTRVSGSGVVLDTAAISISPASGNPYIGPTVGFDETDFIVVWEGTLDYSSLDILGSRVSSDGVVLDPDGVGLSTGPNHQRTPVIAKGPSCRLLAVNRTLSQYPYGSWRAWGNIWYGPEAVIFASASAVGKGGYVTLSWQMMVDVPTSDFVIQRSDSPEGDFAALDVPVTRGEGLSYSSADHSVTQGRTYWYRITISSPFRAEVYGPIEVYIAVIPTAYHVYQSFPNPFNPLCTIRYDIPVAGRVCLQVFDATGRPVRTLVDAHREPGSYSELWDGRAEDGRELPSGVYFYRLEAGDFVATRKMVLLK
ncbi:MAG: T9SS type A sorting domain-containing protein [Candidatus Eiseniibacteriota bacterium]|nr:MAG: T9SS type A sorting domain-containing protein [Candidatus Eisenbacteria bacterium]